MENYHLSRNGRTIGIYPEDKMREYIAQGRVGAGDLVWKPGMARWLPASEVFGFAPEAPPPPSIDEAPPPLGAAPSTPAAAPLVPLPPRLHWAWVLLLSVVTLGLFYVVWAFVQAMWVRRIDPASNGVTLLIVYLVLTLVGELIADTGGKDSTQALVGALISLAGAVVSIVAFFSMRRSLVTYYNEVEPIGLKLGGVMTFFFNVLYFQHHFTRIVRWKEGGGLTPQ
jgi:hypothetical protein